MDKYSEFYTYYKNEDWENAKSELLKFLEIDSQNFWYNSSLSSVYYELRNYPVALKYAKKAFELNPNSPLVLWDYAGVLYMLDQEKKAIEFWEKIISLDDNEIAFELTTEGIKWAKSLKCDSYYRVGQAHYYLEDDNLAKKFLQLHLEKRKRGIKSRYKKSEVISFLDKINRS